MYSLFVSGRLRVKPSLPYVAYGCKGLNIDMCYTGVRSPESRVPDIVDWIRLKAGLR
jgi:hypothetical protein